MNFYAKKVLENQLDFIDFTQEKHSVEDIGSFSKSNPYKDKTEKSMNAPH